MKLQVERNRFSLRFLDLNPGKRRAFTRIGSTAFLQAICKQPSGDNEQDDENCDEYAFWEFHASTRAMVDLSSFFNAEYNKGTRISVSTVETSRPPMTARAS